MDQRNANGGGSTGPLAVEDPWSTFAEDQLGLMDHLGIRESFHGLTAAIDIALAPKAERDCGWPSRCCCDSGRSYPPR
jgi:hypothetical protein